MQKLPEELKISIHISRFNSILKSWAPLHINRTKTNKNPKALDQSTHTSKDLPLQPTPLYYTSKLTGMCWWLSESIRCYQQSKGSGWKNVLHSSLLITDNPDVQKIIRALNGTPDNNLANKAMPHNSLTIINIKSKANIFINHYTRISKLHISKEDRDLHCFIKKPLNTPSVNNKSWTSMNMLELLSTIQKMKCNEAVRPDNIPLTFLKLLVSLALQELLSISTLHTT